MLKLRVLGDVKLGRDREFSAPRQTLAGIAAAPESWAALRADVAGDTFVDDRRALV